MGRGSLVLAFIVMSIFIISCAARQNTPAPVQTPTDNQPAQQPAVQQPAQQKQEISAEVQELLGKHKTKVSSIRYNYRGPETGDNFYKFYVKGTKIKYEPYLAIKTLDKQESYDTIIIDTATNTAQSYCVAAYCTYQGMKSNLDYDEAYIDTIFDWLNVAQAAKVGEEVIDSRSTWKIQTEKGILWVDVFYGIPLKVDADGDIYKFEQLSVNSVTDGDVKP